VSASERTENTGPDVAAANATSSALPAVLAAARSRLAGVAAEIAFVESADALNVTVPVAALLDVCRVARHQLGYRLLTSITGVDWKDSYELIYHLYQLDSAYPLVIRVRLPHDEAPSAPSLTPEWPGAEFQEREVYDLLGIVFAGHPDLRRILLDDDFAGHPLRKDYQADPDYVLVPDLRLPGYAGATPGRTSTGRFLPENDAKKDGGDD
jgi:NADH-quinone oxidoreductase subunit C